ncbi:Uncharacterized protein PECH_001817 [Penicillium ucsense]|uniref:Tetratricopeptide SHNi-TPR domain-containing protein n=1 Tax=Penicillium ucsense TaxID=2839758 RepID=A0A8J8W942_9EURO|nr:Uncharacterized protein PECM_008115 [Penicillium ucsense]KAF7738163.1 Uncharacterized protein PECH_001817 [Penicillium ucsense]
MAAESEQSQTTSAQIENPTMTDKQQELNELITRAAAKDAAKDHNAASELYSQATELQAELNGEMSPENADLLYAYGKSLYNVAVSKSDVLGSKVAGEQPQSSGGAATAKPSSSGSGAAATGGSLVKDAISSSMAEGPASSSSKGKLGSETESAPTKPFFQFTGDENFVDSDDEDAEEVEGEGDEEEEEDDFANAFEVLDLARVLYMKRLEAAEESSTNKGKGKTADMQLPADLKHIKERLADTYDLQAEISLEGERFSDAVADLRTALDLRNTLFPFEDPSVAECHYKLSLALEFASQQQQQGEGQDEDQDGQEKTVDEEMRKEAAEHMERAIESCKARMASEQQKLDSGDLDEDKKIATKRRISNSKEIIADMEQRLIDLRRAPVTVEQREQENEAMLKGILGQIVGQSVPDQQARLDAVSKDANDLSSLVRRKPAVAQSSGSSSSKRPAEDTSADSESKRARVEDA